MKSRLSMALDCVCLASYPASWLEKYFCAQEKKKEKKRSFSTNSLKHNKKFIADGHHPTKQDKSATSSSSSSFRWFRDKCSASHSGGHEIESWLGKSQSLGCFLSNQLQYCLGIARTLNHEIIILFFSPCTQLSQLTAKPCSFEEKKS